MLSFDEEFFKEEIRCDFVVEEKMKRAWAAELEVLSEIIRVCKKYNLTYYADLGTLLGAVRHKGFVPWDDDIDIALKRKDYLKLMQVLPQEVPKEWRVSSIHTEGEHNLPHSGVMNSWVINTDPEIIKRFHGCPYIVGVDVYALDYLPRDAELAETRRLLYDAVYDVAMRYPELEASGELSECISKIEEVCGVTFDMNRPMRKQLWLLGEQLCNLFHDEESDYLTYVPRTVYKRPKFKLKKEWYAETVQLPFENIMISAPAMYDEVLTAIYKDYKTLKKGGGRHEYPFYKKQDEYLRQCGKEIF